MIATRLRRWLAPLARTPLHPQWLVLNRDNTLNWAARHCRGRVLDIGCGEAHLRQYLHTGCDYIGLDYPATRALGYGGHADVLADGARLPLTDASIDTVVLLDVLEHVRHPDVLLAESRRVLRPGGAVLIQTPFLYPLHDEPHDYRRWTAQGLCVLLEAAGLYAEKTPQAISTNLDTATALTVLALARSALDAVARPRPALLLVPLIVLGIPLLNLCGWLLARALPDNGFMPLGYRVIGNKPNAINVDDAPSRHTRRPNPI